jgi:hypothetical protein
MSPTIAGNCRRSRERLYHPLHTRTIKELFDKEGVSAAMPAQ